MVCKICGSTECIDLKKKVRGSEKAKVFYCGSCDYAFLEDVEIDEAFYESEFDTFMAERAGDRSWENSEEHFEKRMEDARSRVDALGAWVDMKKIGSIVELGSSSGFLLKAIEERYPDIRLVGVEPSKKHRDHARKIGLQVYEDLDSLGSEKFDLVLSYFVLEHILDPVEWLNSLKANTGKGTKFIAVVPNLNEALVKIYKDDHYDKFVWQAPHVSYFSEKSLDLLLKKAYGNAEVHNMQRYTLSNHLNWLSGIKPSVSIEYDHIDDEMNALYAKSLEKHGIADTLIGVSEIEV